MKIVGITGNIGSGKTTACRVFEILGIPVFHADIEGRKILTDPHIKEKIVNEFGSEMLNTDDEIDRKILARIVFENPDNLSKLNRIIHPEVHKQFQQWLVAKQDFSYVLYEAAILFESGHAEAMDRIITVTAPESIRIKRVMKRDSVSAEDVNKRSRQQWDESRKIEKSDFTIINDDEHLMIPQIL